MEEMSQIMNKGSFSLVLALYPVHSNYASDWKPKH